MDQKVTFGYWGVKGAGEPIRWLLHHLGKEFNEVNPTKESWPEQKAQLVSEGLEFPNLPYLVDGDWKMTESRAIPYYIANKYERSDLFGNDWKELTRLKELEGVYDDIRQELFKAAFNPEYKTKLTEGTQEGSKILTKLTQLSKALGDKEYFLGHITYFDIGFAYFIQMAEFLFTGAGVDSPTTQFENFAALNDRITNLPGIKEHIASEKGQRPFIPPTYLPWNK